MVVRTLPQRAAPQNAEKRAKPNQPVRIFPAKTGTNQQFFADLQQFNAKL
ncbi:hypothetical protein [Roseobacter sp.]